MITLSLTATTEEILAATTNGLDIEYSLEDMFDDDLDFDLDSL